MYTFSSLDSILLTHLLRLPLPSTPTRKNKKNLSIEKNQKINLRLQKRFRSANIFLQTRMGVNQKSEKSERREKKAGKLKQERSSGQGKRFASFAASERRETK
jgi:hypothetical protein